MLRGIRLAAMILATVCAGVPVFAGVVFEGGGRMGNGPALRDGTSVVWAAPRFKISTEAYATSFSVALSRAMGPVDAGFNCWLTADQYLPKEYALASWTIIPKNVTMQEYRSPIDMEPVRIKANEWYYIIIAPTSSDFFGAVSLSGNGYLGIISGDYGQTWTYVPQPLWLRVEGDFVPEPSGLCLLLPGAAWVIIGRRRPRSKIQNPLTRFAGSR